MGNLHQPLLELQELDTQIQEAEARLAAFDPQLEEVDAPVTTLARDVESTRATLETAETDSRRLERAASDKRDHMKRYEERLERVRNVREESAVRAEMDMVRRAVEADETEALERMDQVRKVSLKLSEMEKRLNALREEAEPKRKEILETRGTVERELDALRDRRRAHAEQIPQQNLRLYERVRTGRRKVLVPLTASGACGNCFNTLPIQEQSRVRDSDKLHTCEACGVILYPSP